VAKIERLRWRQNRTEFASRFILESIGIAVETSESTWLDEMLKRFSGSFPKTRDFSPLARETLKDVTPKVGVDQTLKAWMEREEILLRTLKRHVIAERLPSLSSLPNPSHPTSIANAPSSMRWFAPQGLME
jgi:hypothetical protein